VMHYDLEWNPAVMEQKTGRVDRIGSLSWRERQPVEIFYVWRDKTYEAAIAEAVRRRLRMMRLLLGAGNWLSDDPGEQRQLEDFERKYRLSFSP